MTDHERMKTKITQIENMQYPQLCAMFAELFNGAVCPTNTRTLKNRLIYKVQEMHLGGISQSDMQLLLDISGQKGARLGPSYQTAGQATSMIHYIREWKGKSMMSHRYRKSVTNWTECSINPCRRLPVRSRGHAGTENCSLESKNEEDGNKNRAMRRIYPEEY